MSTTLLYHRFGIVGYRYVSQFIDPGITTFRIEQSRERLRCSHCCSEDVWAQGGVERTFRALPIGKQPTFIQFKVPRVLCLSCGKVRQVKIGFADPKKHHTRAFERYALELSRLMTIQDEEEGKKLHGNWVVVSCEALLAWSGAIDGDLGTEPIRHGSDLATLDVELQDAEDGVTFEHLPSTASIKVGSANPEPGASDVRGPLRVRLRPRRFEEASLFYSLDGATCFKAAYARTGCRPRRRPGRRARSGRSWRNRPGSRPLARTA